MTTSRFGTVCVVCIFPQPPGAPPLPPQLSAEQEDELIRLVLAQELGSIGEKIEIEDRYMMALRVPDPHVLYTGSHPAEYHRLSSADWNECV